LDTFENFLKYNTVDQRIILKYKDKLPGELIEVWYKYGFGTLLNGFLKLINPDEYLDILERCYRRYEQAIPIFTTSMGDIIVWEKINMLTC
jgi:hypothetical protein